MMAIIANGGRQVLSVPFSDYSSAPVAERAEAFITFAAYAGSYTVKSDRVVHHVEAAWVQNIVGTDFDRFATLAGNRLTLRTPEQPLRGTKVVLTAVWERMKPRDQAVQVTRKVQSM
jgi:hypothetical protein